MSDDLIRRSDAIKALCDITNNSDMQEDWHRGISVSISALYRVPSADKPQGEWEDYDRYMKCCSKCGWIQDILHFGSNFCPNCGSRMRGGKDD